MRLAIFLHSLGLGGTEKAACRWARGLQARGHQVLVLSLRDGPRRQELQRFGVPVQVVPSNATELVQVLRQGAPEAIHVHSPGFFYKDDVLGQAVTLLSQKIPLVQTNIFGRLENPCEDAWTDFRLFISWTSCVQAARRSFRRLDEAFFRRASVAVYPVDPLEPTPAGEIKAFRQSLAVADDEVLFGRFSRPEPNKWTELALTAFQLALRHNRRLKLLLREPPPAVTERLRQSPERDHFLILPATSEADELRLTMSALDVVLHTSSIGESFGYGIAEPMNLGKPVISHSVPWQDQAQIELVRPGECGLIASTAPSMAQAIQMLAGDAQLRQRFGEAGREHIRRLAAPETSLIRLEQALALAMAGKESPFASEDLRKAKETAAYLDTYQFGNGWREQLALRPLYWRVRFHEWRKALRRRSA